MYKAVVLRHSATFLHRLDMDPIQKMQLKELVGKIGEISDQADRVSRSVYIINIKRRV